MLAGPWLPIKQMETWLPLWMDGLRAAAKQLADQACRGDPTPRPSSKLPSQAAVLGAHGGSEALAFWGGGRREGHAHLVSPSLRYGFSPA